MRGTPPHGPPRLWLLQAVLLAALCFLPAGAPAQEAAPEAAAAAEPAAEAETAAQALERVDKQEFDLGRALESARLDLASAQRRFAAAEARFDSEGEPGPGLREEVAARRLQLSSAQRIVSLLEEQIERVRAERAAVRRLQALREQRVAPETLGEWTAEAERQVELLGRELTVKRARAEELQRKLEFTRERREQLPPGNSEQRWLVIQARALDDLVTRYEEDARSLRAARSLEQELAAALDRESQDLSLSDRLRAVLHQLRAVWNYQLTGSEREPITPGKIVSAFVIFLIGWFAAGLVSRVLGGRIFSRLRLDEGAAQAFQSLAFYFLLLVAFLTALRVVQIPLTAFAVVGGALAIGVGFGSQNLVSNFISGLILLAERPIKIGDLIDVQGVYGNVESIGLRSTRVRTGDNVHIIVPNASFLETNVINWTHVDPRVRVTLSVGVAYGSPVRDVERLIHQAVSEHPDVMKDPAPFVLFMDFGDNALAFDTRFWIRMRSVMERLRVQSDIRYRIDELFREAGIVIAFPQRDVHLDTLKPLEVRIAQAEAGSNPEDS